METKTQMGFIKENEPSPKIPFECNKPKTK